MTLAPGTHLGSYEIQSPIGAGGMGEVYRARDIKLDRDVAIKILPDAFSHDPERVARFQREAKTLASLNHPNIGGIHGLEESEVVGSGFSRTVRALVLELVEGPTLAERIARGPIPLDEALPIARQIAEALEAAHDHGVIHRDLKPANIKVREDGTVKVLDFGLAKALGPSGGAAADSPALLTQSPTLSVAATQAGVILGTAAYMSPEQARGKPVDKRADIWAFGCVCYEMLTGRRAFQGEDMSDVFVAILRDEPDWRALPPETPAAIRRLLRRALAKDPKLRLREAGSAIVEIEEARAPSDVPARGISSAPRLQPWRPLPVAASVALLVVLAGIAVWSAWPRVEPRPVNRFEVDLPDGQQFRSTGRAVMALSPDGRHVAYNTATGLHLRAMGSFDARLIPGTEASLTNPFFSPDGQSVGYWQAGQLKRVPITGGAPVVICAATNPFGVSWAPDNTLLFAQAQGIMRVSANGATPELVIRAETGERMHGPQLLPGGETVLFSVTTSTRTTRWDEAQIVAQSLRTGERTLLVAGGSEARYLPTGHLVYALGDTLLAAAFDLDALAVRGGPVSMVQGVMRVFGPQLAAGAANYEVSSDGTLVYIAGTGAAARPRTLVWVGRTGREDPLPVPMRVYQYPRLSPDGTRIALDIRDAEQDIWIWDLSRQTLTRLTFDPGNDQYPVWTPDSARLIYTASSGAAGSGALFWQAADGTGAAERLTDPAPGHFHHATTVTRDGTQVIFRTLRSLNLTPVAATDDLMRMMLPPLQRRSPEPSSGASSPTPLVQTMFNERNAEVAPGGQWLAYESTESGREEVYVRPFPNVDGGRWQVSEGGGGAPLWSRDGRELFYRSPDGAVMGVRVESGASWRSSTPVRIIAGPYHQATVGAPGRTYDISRDGQRFLMIKESPADEAAGAAPSIIVVQGWTEELKRRVPGN